MALTLAVVALTAGRSSPGFDRTGSTAVDATAVTIDPAQAPLAYEITYRVEVRTDDGPALTTEVLTVERPFASRVEVRSGPPPGEDVLQRRVSDLLLLATTSAGAEWTALTLPPTLASGDTRLDRSLPDAVERGLLQPREVREVAGVRCQVHRAGGPLTGGIIEPVIDVGTYADVCIDARGLLLEELWFLDGAVARHRVAMEVRVDDVDLGPLPPLTLMEPSQGGGYAEEIAPRDPGPYESAWEAPSVPTGFRHLGRWVVLLPDIDSPLRDPMSEAPTGAVVVADVWRRGADLLVLDQGGRADGQPLLPPHPHGVRVSLGPLGEAELVVDGRASEVRFIDDLGRQVRLHGTLAPDELTALTGELRLVAPVPQGGADG